MIQFTKNSTFLSTSEAAKLIGITESSLRVYVSKQKIEARKIGSCLFFTEKSCKSFLAKRRPVGRPQNK